MLSHLDCSIGNKFLSVWHSLIWKLCHIRDGTPKGLNVSMFVSLDMMYSSVFMGSYIDSD